MYSSTNIPDYVKLEQYYLDLYVLAYNVNRNATPAAYSPSTGPVNVGVDNPSYGLTSTDSPVWGNTHSAQLKALWASTRGSYTFYVYDIASFLLLVSFTSASQLSKFIPGVSKRFGTDIAKLLQLVNLPALCYGKFIISLVELTADEINTLLPNMPIKVVKLPRASSPTGSTIYGFNPSSNTFQE